MEYVCKTKKITLLDDYKNCFKINQNDNRISQEKIPILKTANIP